MPKLHFLLQSRSDYLYKFKKFPKNTARVHLPGICHSTGFPQTSSQNRKVQIQAYSGHKGNCTSPSCIWTHFSLLRDENITSSFYSFMHILHFFAFLTNSLGQFWKCLKFLKKKWKEIKRKWKNLKTCISSFSLSAFPNSSPTDIFCLGVKLQIPNEISHFCIKHFWVAAFPACQGINSTSFILKFKFRTIFM